jgi:predicted TIM-barrel fold metal-dependent hydrolase
MARWDKVTSSILALIAPERLFQREVQRCGEIIDPHIHIAPWFQTVEPLLEELQSANISQTILYNPYPKMILPFDMNTFTHSIALQSEGVVYSLASLNTTHAVWEDHREEEMARLASFLSKPEVLGTKLAPPHTCLKLQSPQMDDTLRTIHSAKRAKVLAIHIGTTPFCGPLGEQFNLTMCCQRDYVDPELLIPQIEAYPDITFVLLHAGHEFLPSDSPYYYNFEFVNKSITLAKTYDNVWISLSAMFAQNSDKSWKYPGGLENCRTMKRANVTRKLLWGSDASYIRGQMRTVLIQSIRAMVQAGFTPPERCWILAGAAKAVFQIPTLGSSQSTLQQHPPTNQHVQGSEQEDITTKEEL